MRRQSLRPVSTPPGGERQAFKPFMTKMASELYVLSSFHGSLAQFRKEEEAGDEEVGGTVASLKRLFSVARLRRSRRRRWRPRH